MDYWYSLDGMGRYRVEYTQAEIKDDTAPLSIVTGKITNKYERLQNTTKVVITKRWKDHQNENKVRPGSICLVCSEVQMIRIQRGPARCLAEVRMAGGEER